MGLVKYIGPYRPGVTVTETDGSTIYCPYNSAVLVTDTLEALLELQTGMWADGGDGAADYTPPTPTMNIPVRSKVAWNATSPELLLDLRSATAGQVIGVDGSPVSLPSDSRVLVGTSIADVQTQAAARLPSGMTYAFNIVAADGTLLDFGSGKVS